MNIELPRGFRDRALAAVAARQPSPLHLLTDDDLTAVAAELATPDCSPDILRLIAVCVRAAIEDRANELLGGHLCAVESDDAPESYE